MTEYYTFRGNVIPHETYDQQSPNYAAAFQIFKLYWKVGFHPMLGLDAPLSQPRSIQMSAIGHSHLKPVSFTGKERETFKKYNPTEQCWDKWSEGRYQPGSDAPSKLIPESDEWIIYCVDANRNACVLAYIPMDAHVECHANSEFISTIMRMAEKWYSDQKSHPMSFQDMSTLFDSKWYDLP